MTRQSGADSAQENGGFVPLLDAAWNPDSGPETLRDLYHELRNGLDASSAHMLSDALARHPNAPVDILAALAYRSPKALAENPALPLLPLEHPDLLEQFPEDALPRLLARPELPVSFVALCRRHPNPEIAGLAVWHVSVAARFESTQTAWQTAALDELSRLPLGDEEALWELLEYDRAPRELAERLGFSAVHAPVHPIVRAFAERRREAAGRPRRPEDIAPPPDGWESLVQSDFPEALKRAADPRTPPDALRRLLWFQPNPAPPDYDRPLLAYHILHNVATPPDVLAACRDQNTAATVAAHPNADARLLRLVLQRAEEVMISDARYLDVLCAVLSNPATPPEVLREALNAARRTISLNRPELRSAAALFRRLQRWHPALTKDAPIFPSPEDPFEPPLPAPRSQAYVLYLTVARLPLLTVPPARPESLAQDADWSARFAAALNPFASEELRDALCEDGHTLVRAAARARRAAPDTPVFGVPGDPGRAWAI
jgi:hypothetical protein